MPLEQYQDIWVDHRCASRGKRECTGRYDIIKTFCQQFQRPFSVLDIGANLGYFSFRLAEDFPSSTVTMIESPLHYGPWLQNITEENAKDNIILLKHHLSQQAIFDLSQIEHFDVVLALSMIHHIPGDPAENLELIQLLGEYTIVEYPVEDTACNPNAVAPLASTIDPSTIIGHAPSHLTSQQRPIAALHTPKQRLFKSYHRALRGPENKEITSTTTEKTLCDYTTGNKVPWIHGINLWTFTHFGGSYPSQHTITAIVHDHNFNNHPDIRPWNVIISGTSIATIDDDDPTITPYDPVESKELLLQYLTTGYAAFPDAQYGNSSMDEAELQLWLQCKQDLTKHQYDTTIRHAFRHYIYHFLRHPTIDEIISATSSPLPHLTTSLTPQQAATNYAAIINNPLTPTILGFTHFSHLRALPLRIPQRGFEPL